MTYNSKEKNFDLENFQESYENNLLKINQKIAEQENKKNEISCFLDTVSNLNIIESNVTLDSTSACTQEISEILENINTNIQKLNSLKDELINLNNSHSSASDNDSTDIQDKVSAYQLSFDIISDIIISTDDKIDVFIKKINQTKAFEVSQPLTDSNSAISNSDINYSVKDNNTLIISEKENKIFLPYSESELQAYIKEYPKDYTSLESVINKEFVLPLDYYTKHPSLSRFREAYSLIRDREAKSVFEALNFGFNLMFNYELNPAIISACKTEDALNFYVECLENNKLSEFDLFKIEFRLNPMKTF